MHTYHRSSTATIGSTLYRRVGGWIFPIAFAALALAGCGMDVPVGTGGGGAGGGGGSGGGATIIQCADPEHPSAPCVTADGCDGTCYPPLVADAGINPGMCLRTGACGTCFVTSDCAGFFAPACHEVQCDPTGKNTAPGAPMHGCNFRPVSGGACVTPDGSTIGTCQLAGGDSVCQPPQ